MSTTIDIQNYVISKTTTKIQLHMQYIFSATEGSVEVVFLSATDEILNQQTVLIPSLIYASWTTDDATIEDYVLTELGLTRL